MIPHEREMVERLKDKPFALVSISADEKKETLTDFLAKEKMPWTHWWNGSEGGDHRGLGRAGFPTIYVLDAQGVIRHKDLRGEELEKAVNALLDGGEDQAGQGGVSDRGQEIGRGRRFLTTEVAENTERTVRETTFAGSCKSGRDSQATTDPTV